MGFFLFAVHQSLEPIDEGQILLDGRGTFPARSDPARGVAGRIRGSCSSPSISSPHMTAAENVMLGPRQVYLAARDVLHSGDHRALREVRPRRPHLGHYPRPAFWADAAAAACSAI